MTRKQLILDRYEVMGTAGSGGFGTVQIAWDPRIQRKVAIKTIQLTERDAERAALSGVQAILDEARESFSTPALDESLNETLLLGDNFPPKKALSPAEARNARETAEKEAEEELRAMSQAWETPWVQIPDNAEIAEAVNVEPTDPVEPDEPVELEADTILVTEVASSENPSHSLSESVPLVMQLPEISKPAFESTQEIALPTISAETTAEMAAVEVEPSKSENSEDDYVNPTTIISEARESLQNMEPHESSLNWDSRYPWVSESVRASDGQEDDLNTDSYAATIQQFDNVASEENAQAASSLSRKNVEQQGRASDEPITTLVHVPGLDEARTAAKLSDQRIVTVYDFEVRDQTAYLIMEYVEGITLARLLDEYPNYITLDMVTGVFDAVAGALEIAHDAGVLHLDIKPDNIMINKDGQVKVTDFGLATLADASGHGFAGGGTIGYMPLEQMRREELDVRTDEWALAAMTYEMLTGGNPFKARTLDQAQQAILNAELVLPSLCWPRVDAQLDDVLFYALDPDREERYASIGDFADEVDKFLGDPDSGQEQLAIVVEDALSDPEPVVEQPKEPREKKGEANRTGLFGLFDRFRFRQREEQESRTRQRRSATRESFNEGELYEDYPVFAPSSRLEKKLGEYGPDDALYEDDYYEEEDIEEVEPVEHIPLNERIPAPIIAAAARVFNGIGCAFVTGIAFWNFEPLRSIPDEGAYFGAIIGAAIFGVLGVLIPAYGALVSFCLLGLVVCLCGHPIVGAVLILITVLWWYVVGRDGMAENNIALLGPLGMSMGAASITPLFAGVSLKPLQAALTLLYSIILVCVFSSFGGSFSIGWDFFGLPTLNDADVTLSFARIFMRPITLTMAAGWIIGGVLFSLLMMKSSRWTFIVGLVLCVICTLAGSLVFTAPTPQLIVPVLLGAAVLLAIFL